ncbi:MAG: tRNA preQ1(34) S-adenosylmethionine ribosyltransferase-isomerase QueA [Rhodospirillales bacterium]|nr:tRNA preQ1(34) S-adenosylmethionine ribosyltransferase-isomerase QueA [Rhodospirillales bacterium]
MKTSDFYFDLPKELIASEPLAQRSASRLFCLQKDGTRQHRHFYDLPDLLQEGDLLVFNNSRVIPARLYGQKPTGGKLEILIERVISDRTALAHVKGSKNLKTGSSFFISTFFVTVSGRQEDLLELTAQETSWQDIMAACGHIPLPPYMEREDRQEDRTRYQTVYARHDGSVAAPTAGLHFDEDTLARLKQKGIKSAFVTLHVGAGTFQPVRVEDTDQHKMHKERFEITQETCDEISKTWRHKGRVIAVGTTTVRVLESVMARPEKLHACTGETDIFITPGYQFQAIDGLITNFHLPESTLLMLVSAFSGKENILNTYREAVEAGYRFFSYGDAMLLT